MRVWLSITQTARVEGVAVKAIQAKIANRQYITREVTDPEDVSKTRMLLIPALKTGDPLVDSLVDCVGRIAVLKKQMENNPDNLDVCREFGRASADKVKIGWEIDDRAKLL